MPTRGTPLADTMTEQTPATPWSRPMPTGWTLVSTHRLTPEEDALDDPDETAEAIDDTLPADLWFAINRALSPRATAAVVRNTLVRGSRP